MMGMPLNDQELHCIARQLQKEMYTPEEKQFRGVDPCWLCKYSFTCKPPVGLPNVLPRKPMGIWKTPYDVIRKLMDLTGVDIYRIRKGISLEETLLQGSWADTMPLEECVKPFEENIRVYTEAMEFMDSKRGQDDEVD